MSIDTNTHPNEANPSAVYSQAQIDRYFRRIYFPKKKHPASPLAFAYELQYRHLAAVPVDSVSLHYSPRCDLSLRLDKLYEKIVVKQRGGYSLELNTFFGAILRSLGYEVLSTGARTKSEDGYNGWDHMVNIITIDGKRYLSDVGFGIYTPIRLLQLCQEKAGSSMHVSPRCMKVHYKQIDQPGASNPGQKLWVYSTWDATARSPNPVGINLKEHYCFSDVEFFPEDLEMMHLAIMAKSPDRMFNHEVIATRFVYKEQTGDNAGCVPLVGDILLEGNQLRRTRNHQVVKKMTLGLEIERVWALEEDFNMILEEDEQYAIEGRPSEIKTPEWRVAFEQNRDPYMRMFEPVPRMGVAESSDEDEGMDLESWDSDSSGAAGPCGRRKGHYKPGRFRIIN